MSTTFSFGAQPSSNTTGTGLSFGTGTGTSTAGTGIKSGFTFGAQPSTTSQVGSGLTFGSSSTGNAPSFGTGQTTFGAAQNTSTGATTSLFGSGPTTTQPQTTSLFQSSTNQQQTTNPSSTFSTFGQQGNSTYQATPQLQMGSNNNQIRPPQPNLNQPLTFDLQSSNSCRYDKIGNVVNPEFKNAVFKIEETITNNDIILENNEILHNKLEENKKIMLNECNNIIKMTKLITSHHKNCRFIIENLNRDLNDQITLVSKVKKNINILENHSSIKIQIPNDYFETCVAEMDSKIEMFSRKLLDLESLILATEGQETAGSEQEMIESTIMEFYTILDHLNQETVRLNEQVKIIKENYILVMLSYGYKEDELENRYNAFLRKELI